VPHLWKVRTLEGNSILSPFTEEEFATVLSSLEPGKSPVMDSIFSEFILHSGSAIESWLFHFLTSCLLQLKMPKIWRNALAVAIRKPDKPLGDAKKYLPISLLCLPFKTFERFIYARLEPIMDPLLPQEQVGVWHGRLTVDQVTLLWQNIEDGFSDRRRQELCLSISQRMASRPHLQVTAIATWQTHGRLHDHGGGWHSPLLP